MAGVGSRPVGRNMPPAVPADRPEPGRLGGSRSIFQLDLLQLAVPGNLAEAPEDRLQELNPEEKRYRYQREDYRCRQVPHTNQRAERGKDPDDGGGCYADQESLQLQDDSTPQEADSGHHLTQHPGGIHPVTSE